MSGASQRYEEVLAAARALSQDDRQRLIADLAAGLVPAPVPGAPEPDLPLPLGENLWGGFMVIKDSPAGGASIVTNGIDAETGEYLVSLDPAAARRVAAATAELPEEKARQALYKHREQQRTTAHLGMVHGIPYKDLAQAGWAVVVAEEEDTRLLDALAPLINHRSDQQGITRPDLRFAPGERCGAWFRRVLGPRGEGSPLRPMGDEPKLPVLVYDPRYPQPKAGGTSRPGSCGSWLGRYGVSAGPVVPRRGVPFYLLIAGRPGPVTVGDQAYIPFGFQYDLDVFWGVGRLCFTDERGGHDYGAYRRYAEQVVAFEQERARGVAPPYGRRMVFFATRHDRDPATEESEAQLVLPLAGLAGAPAGPGVAEQLGFEQTVLRREAATKDALGRALSGRLEGGRPAVLFTAGHGAAYRPENALLPRRQGGLICHGRQRGSAVADEMLFSGDSFDELGASVAGMIAVMFACYGVGCPQVDTYSFTPGRGPTTIAPYALISRLPQRMLAGGALAVLGHVDKAWSYGFSQPEENLTGQSQAFEDVLKRLLDGEPLGYVTDQFNTVQSTHAGLIMGLLDNARFAGGNPNFGLDKIGTLWKAYHDMRSYMLLGDPAVRLPFTRPAAPPSGA